ncbi:MAG: site-2 protease family protein, partial [Clostridia bacterium]|nr:site-2 protease family protein [Clostridia bacterium]
QKREYQSTVEDEAGNVTVQKAWGFGIMQSYTAYHLGFFESIGRSVSYCLRMGWVILGTVGQLITGQLGLDAVGGPLTTIGMTAEVARSGFRYFLDIVVMIDVNLAVMNLLPIPALDGCRIIFTAIEWIRRKPVNRKVEAIVHTVGLLLLFGFVILADINQLFFL